LSGAGPIAAAHAAALLIEEGVCALVSWGCAAALDPHLKPGDLILPRRIVGADGVLLETSRDWRDRLSGRLAGRLSVHQGALAESTAIIATPTEKARIFAETGAIALDMESAAIARAALGNGLPFLAIRAIADPAAMTVPASVLVALDETGKVRIPKVLSHALLNPGDFPGLIRLGWHFRAAMKTLREVKAMAGAGLASP
jgi:adenosylhomocysteine nucleosidase